MLGTEPAQANARPPDWFRNVKLIVQVAKFTRSERQMATDLAASSLAPLMSAIIDRTKEAAETRPFIC
jgi:hypothetical protein